LVLWWQEAVPRYWEHQHLVLHGLMLQVSGI
jgi:hypothetical protein